MTDLSPRRIKRVIVWQNGLTMVFDQYGEQMPEYQGRLDEIEETLAAAFPRERWEYGNWQSGVIVQHEQLESGRM
jgi:hypothetical protein